MPPQRATLGSAPFVCFNFRVLLPPSCAADPASVNVFNLLFPDWQTSPYGIIHEPLSNQEHLFTESNFTSACNSKGGGGDVRVAGVGGNYLM